MCDSIKSSPMIDLKDIISSLNIKDVALSSSENMRVGKAPILDNGLNLMYAPQGYGKSFTAVKIAKETGLASVYFDLESNGRMFVDYCKSNDVVYVYMGDNMQPLDAIQAIVKEINKRYGKVFIIIDSFSDLYPNDDLAMPTASQKALGALNKFFMRQVEMPVLLLDHATEKENGYKIEGNKSGKFKKTQLVMRLDKIDNNIKNGTFIIVERSRDHDVLKVNHKQVYQRSDYLKKKLLKYIDEGKLKYEFTAKDLEDCLSGDDRSLWRTLRDEIACSKSVGRRTVWTLYEGDEKSGRNVISLNNLAGRSLSDGGIGNVEGDGFLSGWNDIGDDVSESGMKDII